jgi:hypothetical protein
VVIDKLAEELAPNDWYFNIVLRGAVTWATRAILLELVRSYVSTATAPLGNPISALGLE